MAHRVTVEFTTRALARLHQFPPEIQTFHARGGYTDYITFKWPYRLPKRPAPADFTYVLLIASLGNWDERFKEILKSGDLWLRPVIGARI